MLDKHTRARAHLKRSALSFCHLRAHVERLEWMVARAVAAQTIDAVRFLERLPD